MDAENDSPEEYNNLEIDIGDVVEADSFVMIEYYSNDGMVTLTVVTLVTSNYQWSTREFCRK